MNAKRNKWNASGRKVSNAIYLLANTGEPITQDKWDETQTEEGQMALWSVVEQQANEYNRGFRFYS